MRPQSGHSRDWEGKRWIKNYWTMTPKRPKEDHNSELGTTRP